MRKFYDSKKPCEQCGKPIKHWFVNRFSILQIMPATAGLRAIYVNKDGSVELVDVPILCVAVKTILRHTAHVPTIPGCHHEATQSQGSDRVITPAFLCEGSYELPAEDMNYGGVCGPGDNPYCCLSNLCYADNEEFVAAAKESGKM